MKVLLLIPFLFTAQITNGQNFSNSKILFEKKLKNNVYIKFIATNNEDNYKIQWGNKSINKSSKRFYQKKGDGYLHVIDYNSKYIILSNQCGTMCTQFVILPIKKNKKENEYSFVKAFNLSANLIAYAQSVSDSLNVKIENFSSGKSMIVREADVCPAVDKQECIDSCYFDKENFYLFWQGRDWTSKRHDSKEKSYHLDQLQ